MRTRSALAATIAAASLMLVGCSSSADEESDTTASSESCAFDHSEGGVTATRSEGETPTLTIAEDAKPPKELQAIDLCPGEGVEVETTDTIVADYVGVDYETQQEFDSSYAAGQPATFPVGGVIQGWQEGVPGMKPGGVRLLLIPSDMGYGDNPAGPAPGGPLAFIVEIEQVLPPAGTAQ